MNSKAEAILWPTTAVKVLIAASVIVLIVLLAVLAAVSNLTGYRELMTEGHTALREVLAALWVGAIILFWVALGLGVLYAVIKLNHARKVRVVGPNKHGQMQALVRSDGTIELLSGAASQVDPMQQLATLEKIMKIAQQSAMMQKRYTVAQESDPTLQIAAPAAAVDEEPVVERIPEVVLYEDVKDEIPEGMSLLGIHPEDGDLELTNWKKLKMMWIVGSSSSGKSNTVYGKAQEAVDRNAKILAVDQHAGKEDSLARKLAPLKEAFLRPIAVTDEEVLATIAWFRAEFERRIACACGKQENRCARCAQEIVLICDEMNRMVRNEKLVKPLKEIVEICGEESRGFGMYGWFISQKCAHLKWLRDSAITVIVHKLTRFEEALLACNDDRKAAKRLLSFKVGRTYIYGVDFDEPMELHQALHKVPKMVESTISPVSASEREKDGGSDSLGEREPGVQSEIPSKSSSANSAVQPDGKVAERTFPFEVAKLGKIRELIAQEKNQQDIVCEVWGVQPSTRQFHEAVKEYRKMLAYLASVAAANQHTEGEGE